MRTSCTPRLVAGTLFLLIATMVGLPATASATIAYTNNRAVYLMNDDGTNGHAAGFKADVARPSADGQHLALLDTHKRRASIGTIDTHAKRLLRMKEVTDVRWLDGSTLLVTSSTQKWGYVWKVPVTGTGTIIWRMQRPCTEGGCDFPGLNVWPSPDGKMISVTGQTPAGKPMAIISPTGKLICQIRSKKSDDWQDWSVSWAPDSTAMAVAESPYHSLGSRLTLIKPSGTRTVLVKSTAPEIMVADPAFSGTGTAIAWSRYNTSTQKLRVMRLDVVTKASTPLTSWVASTPVGGPNVISWNSPGSGILAMWGGKLRSVNPTTAASTVYATANGTADAHWSEVALPTAP